MENLIGKCLGILGQYDNTINAVRAGWTFTLTDNACDTETRSMSESLLIAVLVDKSTALLPDDEDEQLDILDTAEGIEDALKALPDITPLLMTVIVLYALALSRSNWGWIPWQDVRNAILDSKEEH